ncbi:MAG TPA: lipocalin family protein [Spirochaetota bacterium]|nr:lipocalin family protein [Spirochaetota bacterium]
MSIRSFSAAAIFLLMISCTATAPDIKDEASIDYRLYQGKWYEIARLPNSIESGLTCITMTYEYRDEGVMIVTNSGRNKSNPEDIRTLSGRAWIPDGKEPQKIKIQFIWPVTLDYQLLHIDEDKGYAILGSPMKHQLWILSRSTVINEEDFAGLIKIAEKNQYKTESIIRVEQGCD